ncbi:MAG TPA: response regulator transcription factor [Candidatus Solibacter sp.]|nr:response regulator transcription factor [Candidatus Solibacter sp.]
MIKLVIVDDHAMFREGLARSIAGEPDLEVAGQFGSSTDALAGLDQSGAQVVLLDIDLGPEKALDFVHGARRKGFAGKILIVTAGASDVEAVQLIQAGVAGILHKHHSTEALCKTIRQVANGEVCLEPKYLGPLFRTVDRSRPPGGPRLTERDRTMLRFILQGLTNRDIARRLEVSEGAVKASLRQVFGKLGVRTRAQLVKVALEQYRDQL